jgi:hydroxyethylthiazole kinase
MTNSFSSLSEIQSLITEAVTTVREITPLAGSITNNVTIDFVANAQLAAGGSAAMVYLADEGETLAQLSQAIYINMGTLAPSHGESIPATAAACAATNTPWVLDPVGIGIGSLRETILREVKAYPPAIIRGNASEIIALAHLWELEQNEKGNGPRGVDSTDEVDAALQAARALVTFTHGAVAISGEEDIVVDETHLARCFGGSTYMPQVTGFGCSLGGVCAVYAGVTSPFVAALAATNVYNLAGTQAHEQCSGPGSFKVAFLDALANASAEDIANASFELL